MAHPGKLRLIFRAKRKSDRVDAQKLAKLLYLDEVPSIHVPCADVRSWRELIEMRRWQVHQVTRVKNAICALMRTYAVTKPPEMSMLWTRQGRAWLGAVPWPTPTAQLRCEVLLAQWDHLPGELRRLTEELDTRAAQQPGVTLLCTIPGVGPRTAEAVIAYIDDPHRYAGLVPREDSSGGKQRLGHLTKEGPATLRWLLVEAAWQVVRREPAMRAYFDRLRAGKKQNTGKAIVAVARKLLRCMVAMLRTGEAWRPPSDPPQARAA